ncbi:MAG: GGDEF domain-containing protein [Lachnospiraceae bacterium]
MKKKTKKQKDSFAGILNATIDSLVGIFSLKKHFPDFTRSDMRKMSSRFIEDNYNRLPAMAALGFIFSVVFILGDIKSDFYYQNFPISILNIIFEGLYFFAGLITVVVIGTLRFNNRTVSPRFKIAIHTAFYVCASVASGLGYVSESLRGQRSIVPMFFIIYFGTITTMPLSLFFFCYGAVFLPALITQGCIGTLEAAEILTAIASGLFFFFNRTIYLRFRITQGELKKANRELMEITITDPLTKVGNRTKLYRIFECNREKWLKDNCEICLVMCDVDNFKNYNDTYSHLKGDECLVKITEMIKKSLPGDETFGQLIRFGGEEFLIVLVGHNLSETLNTMYRQMRENIQSLKLQSGKGAVHEYVTLSFGAYISRFDENFVLEERIRQADSQLYHSKNNGRDKLTVESELN